MIFMDLLFKRYASPFLLLDNYISTGRLSEFISKVVELRNNEMNEQTMWEFYLAKVQGMSFPEFENEIKNQKINESVDFGTALSESKNLLNDFNPEEMEINEEI